MLAPLVTLVTLVTLGTLVTLLLLLLLLVLLLSSTDCLSGLAQRQRDSRTMHSASRHMIPSFYLSLLLFLPSFFLLLPSPFHSVSAKNSVFFLRHTRENACVHDRHSTPLTALDSWWLVRHTLLLWALHPSKVWRKSSRKKKKKKKIGGILGRWALFKPKKGPNRSLEIRFCLGASAILLLVVWRAHCTSKLSTCTLKSDIWASELNEFTHTSRVQIQSHSNSISLHLNLVLRTHTKVACSIDKKSRLFVFYIT